MNTDQLQNFVIHGHFALLSKAKGKPEVVFPYLKIKSGCCTVLTSCFSKIGSIGITSLSYSLIAKTAIDGYEMRQDDLIFTLPQNRIRNPAKIKGFSSSKPLRLKRLFGFPGSGVDVHGLKPD